MKIQCPHCQQEFDYTASTEADTPLRRARRAKGLSVPKAAEAIGISVWTLQRMERGDGDPRMATVRKISLLYGQPVDVLFPPRDVSTEQTAGEETIEVEDEAVSPAVEDEETQE